MSPADDELETNRAAQRALYGETLEQRLGAITRAYGISQRRLARALGISAPMLSQLISARRVKMGNPRAHERMAVREQRSAEIDSPERAEEILEAVGSSDVATTTPMRADTGRTPVTESPQASHSIAAALGEEVGAEELRIAARVLTADGRAPRVAALLEAALTEVAPEEPTSR